MSENIGKGFSLVMELEDPSRLPELMARLGSESVKPRIQAALASLDYVHFARFLPLWDRGLLMIITEFDGAMPDYVMDFAAVLDDEFSLILSYMKGQPPLPVSRYPGNSSGSTWTSNTGPKTTDPHSPIRWPTPMCSATTRASRRSKSPAPRAKRWCRRKNRPRPTSWTWAMCRPTRSAATRRRWPATWAFSSKAAKPARDMLAALAPHLTNANTSREPGASASRWG